MLLAEIRCAEIPRAIFDGSSVRSPVGPQTRSERPVRQYSRSPSIANDAVTPPVVGSVNRDIYGIFALSSRASAAEILANCIRLITPSIIRAPPEAETIIKGVFEASARSTARVIISPTTAPMLPPMNAYSITLATTGPSQQFSLSVDDCIFQSGVALRLLQPRRVRLQIHKLQRVG